MSKPGTTSGAVEHRFGGKGRILVNREHAELLRQEAIIRRDFGEEGVHRFWEEVNKRADTELQEQETTSELSNSIANRTTLSRSNATPSSFAQVA